MGSMGSMGNIGVIKYHLHPDVGTADHPFPIYDFPPPVSRFRCFEPSNSDAIKVSSALGPLIFEGFER